MNDKEIKEMLNCLGYGENIPQELFSLINEFRRRKSAVFPEPITPDNVVVCSMIYEVLMQKNSKGGRNG